MQRAFAEQALSRAAGASLQGGNAIELLIDAPAHFEAWLGAIRGAQQRVLLENYLVRDDEIGRTFRDALVARARAGATVAVMVDWLGCLGQSRASFWAPLRAVGGQVRVYNAPRLGEPFGWLSRDHRKLLVVDGACGFVSGVCLSARWLGDPQRGIPPWRDTGVAVRGPAVADLEAAFLNNWAAIGPPLPPWPHGAPASEPAGPVSLRVIATQPATSGVYRLDQLVAGLARNSLWLSDAYFVGMAPYVHALVAAARDGVDVRMLVPGSSDIPVVARLSRAGYRPLLEAGIRIFEWNGSMLHAKTAVADGRWARVGSSNLNVASWLGNCEIDVAVEDVGFAGLLASQFERDLENATEIVLTPRAHRRRNRIVRRPSPTPRVRGAGGKPGRAAAGVLRIANTLGAALRDPRVVEEASAMPLAGSALALTVLAVLAAIRPAWIAWPLGLLAAWFAVNLAVGAWRIRSRRRRHGSGNP
jgi:cardiolipin synthase